MVKRRLFEAEMHLIEIMLRESKSESEFEQGLIQNLPSCWVQEMNDGGMGSLLFESEREKRSLGKMLAEVTFSDVDGISVIATLNLDDQGELYELDLWKTDFSPIKRLSLP